MPTGPRVPISSAKPSPEPGGAPWPSRRDVSTASSLGKRQGDATLEFFSMICTFGTALDLTADELRLELLFPSDEFSAAFLRQDSAPRARSERL